MLPRIHQQWLKILLSAALLLILPMPVIGEDQSHDVMVYTVNNFDGNTSLTLYDPQTGESSPIVTENEVSRFSLSVDGHLAFSSEVDGNTDIYVLNVFSADQTPMNIIQNASTNEFPLAWSHDGHYLAFSSSDAEGNTQIFVWNGDTIVNITPEDLDFTPFSYSEVSWSFDGRLAFTVFNLAIHGEDVRDSSEIYVWDGKAVTNLSQNPTGEDRGSSWNANGQLAFVSTRGGNYDIFVWDGISLKSGSPDVNTFTNPSPELTDYYSFPTWTNKGLLAFIGFGSQDKNSQVYVWDGHTATNISQNPTLHNDTPVWNAEGEWAFSTYFSPQQLLYVRDAENHTLLTTDGQYNPAWSSSGYLAFCKYDRPIGWILSIWDGQQVIKVAQGREVMAQWNSGSGVYCSSG